MAQKTELPDIAKLSHFTEANLYTGSKTKDWEKGTVIRYKVWPDRENEKLIASCWAQDCLLYTSLPVKIQRQPVFERADGQQMEFHRQGRRTVSGVLQTVPELRPCLLYTSRCV